MGSVPIGDSSKPADYTIVIAKQDKKFVIYPDANTTLIVQTGTMVQFVNTTGEGIKVTVDPDIYQGANPFTIAPESRTLCTVFLTLLSNTELKRLLSKTEPDQITHTFQCDQGGQTEIITGGPKMVPTEPVVD